MNRYHRLSGLAEALLVVAVLVIIATSFLVASAPGPKQCPAAEGEKVAYTVTGKDGDYCVYVRTYAREMKRRKV